MFDKRFDFKEAEERIYKTWEDQAIFKANASSDKIPFVIAIPPPNVTGSLHIGHALNNTIQDLLIRFKRMSGYETLWIPGTDHASIATHFVLERELAKEKTTRFDIGREKFLERAHKWKEDCISTIVGQLKRLGCSCDWSRLRFTMDEKYSHAVKVAFVKLYNKGLIYKGEYVVNWCTRCLTAVSDLELEKKDEKGKLWYIKYPFVNASGYVTVATTRPETMLGDVAVAVNPSDDRYKNLVGKKVLLPFINREIPIIADNFVDSAFGTGAVKITPAHDPNDFECSKRNNLQRICVMDEKGVINKNGAKFNGLSRFECRKRIVEELEGLNLLEKIEDYTVPLSHCHRCSTVIEPYLSLQWFVKMGQLVGPALKLAEDGELKFYPERFRKVYTDWLTNIRDWCISRQLWWGHRIPVWYCKDCKGQMASVDELSKCVKCGSAKIEQDPDILDTWFSSGLWPFATLGWPEKTEDLEKFYPTDVLVTAREIIFLWVARMVINGLEFCKEKPFSDVVINPVVQTLTGKRMSKSLGTGIDPLEIIDNYGTDALRFGLLIQVTQSQDIRFSPDKIETSRNFTTKIWNAARFVFSNSNITSETISGAFALEDRWILSRLQTTIKEYTNLLDSYEFGAAARLAYHFVWDEYCDWYIELSKKSKSESTQKTLRYVLFNILKLLHPMIPFITEDIWQKFGKQLLAIQTWPVYDQKLVDHELEQEMELAIQVIRAVRDVRNKMNISASTKLEVHLDSETSTSRIFEKFRSTITFLANLDKIEFLKGRPRASASYVSTGFKMYVPLEGKIDISAEIKRQESRKRELGEKMLAIERKFENDDFKEKAPPEIVSEYEERLTEIKRHLKEIDTIINDLSSKS